MSNLNRQIRNALRAPSAEPVTLDQINERVRNAVHVFEARTDMAGSAKRIAVRRNVIEWLDGLINPGNPIGELVSDAAIRLLVPIVDALITDAVGKLRARAAEPKAPKAPKAAEPKAKAPPVAGVSAELGKAE